MIKQAIPEVSVKNPGSAPATTKAGARGNYR
jgi:hypothetical protein